MDFIQTANKQVDKFGSGKHGFSPGNPGSGVLATLLSNTWCDTIQQELINTIEGAGIVASFASLTQVRQAIKRLLGGNVRTITAAGPTTLTADDAGLVVLDATSNAVSITLPAVNAVAGVPLSFDFVRIDSTANAVTITRAGADTFVGGGTSVSLIGQGDQRSIRGDQTSKWATVATTNSPFNGSNQSLASNGYQKLPGGLILQWGQVTCSGSADVTWTFPISFPANVFSIVGCYSNGGVSANVLVSTGSMTLAGYNVGAFVANTGARVVATCYLIAIGK